MVCSTSSSFSWKADTTSILHSKLVHFARTNLLSLGTSSLEEAGMQQLGQGKTVLILISKLPWILIMMTKQNNIRKRRRWIDFILTPLYKYNKILVQSHLVLSLSWSLSISLYYKISLTLIISYYNLLATAVSCVLLFSLCLCLCLSLNTFIYHKISLYHSIFRATSYILVQATDILCSSSLSFYNSICWLRQQILFLMKC